VEKNDRMRWHAATDALTPGFAHPLGVECHQCALGQAFADDDLPFLEANGHFRFTRWKFRR
jgi:hypothetical protein